MITLASKNGNGSATPAVRQRRTYQRWAAVLITSGAVLLAYNLDLFPSGPITVGLQFWPVLMILIGLLWITGRASFSFPLPAFAIDRGEYQSGHLHLASGLADAQVSPFIGASQLAVGQFPGYGGPRLQADGSRAALILDRHAASPFLIGPWTISLVKGLPWSLTFHSDMGHFNLNLRDLNVTALDLHSGVGDVDLTLPATGQGEMALRLGLGDLTVCVPEGMAVKIKWTPGPLARTRLDGQRFIQTSPSEWVTPNFSASPQRFTLSVALTAGDLQVI
jgi:hypothetical protein